VSNFSDDLGPMMIICVFSSLRKKRKEIGVHPGFNISEAFGDSRVGYGGDGLVEM